MKKIKKWAAVFVPCMFMLSFIGCALEKDTGVEDLRETLNIILITKNNTITAIANPFLIGFILSSHILINDFLYKSCLLKQIINFIAIY